MIILNSAHKLYLGLLWIVMASSAIVFVEPAPVDAGIILLIFLALILRMFSFEIRKIQLPVIFILIFLLGNLASMFNIDGASISLRYFAITLYLILFWAFTVFISNKLKSFAVDTILSGYTFAAFTSAIIAVSTFMQWISIEVVMKSGRVSGFFKDPNVFGPFMIPIALYAITKIENKKGKSRLLWILIYCVTSTSVLISFSRAAWISFIVSHFIYFSFVFFRKISMKRILGLLLILGVIYSTYSYLMSFPNISYLVQSRTSLQSYDSDRFSNQKVALKLAMETPLGIGPGQYNNYIGYATHNTYLRVWTENGLLGIIGFSCFFVASMFRSYKMAKRTKNSLYIVVFACLAGLAVNGFVIDTIHWRHFWLLLALAWVTLPATKSHPLQSGAKG